MDLSLIEAQCANYSLLMLRFTNNFRKKTALYTKT